MGNACCSCEERPSKSNLIVVPTSKSSKKHRYEEVYDDYESEDDVWFDALQYHEDEEQTGFEDEKQKAGEQSFPVTAPELITLKSELEAKFPQDYGYMDDEYISSVASKPYSKDMTRRRPIEYSLEKLVKVMDWRRRNQVSEMQDWVNLAVHNNHENRDNYDKGKSIVDTLNLGCFYWHGLDRAGRPILWFRAHRLPWFPDVDAQINTLIMLADIGIQKGMANSTTEFVVVCDSKSAPPPHPQFALKMINALVGGYPDRVGRIIISPVSTIVEAFFKMVVPLMPGRLAKKIVFLNMEHCQQFFANEIFELEELPDFLGGPNMHHDTYFPQFPRGNSVLKFDFFGMISRLEQEKAKFESQNTK